MNPKIKINKNINIEDAFSQLSDIVNEIEQDNLSLDETMDLFEKGMLLTKVCQEKLKKAEQKVKVLLDNNKID
tara:strand:+ start:230 stop:448 length:219 start_codon:yes stop_codon:yes gene_type:complete